MSNNRTKINFHTREQLKEYIHSIHDYIRNSGAGYGMEALKLFNVFYSLKILEGNAIEFGLSEECDWGFIRKQYIKYRKNYKDMDFNIYNAINELRNLYLNDNDGKHPFFQFIHDIYDDIGDAMEGKISKDTEKKLREIRDKLGDKIDDVKDKNRNKHLKNVAYFIYYQIPNGLKRNFCADLFEKIDNLPISNEDNSSFDVRGKIYEYFIGRDKQAISDLGAYFTDRHLTSFCMRKGELVISDGKIPTICDIFGGSGGFTLQAVDYLKNKYKNIDWVDNYKRIKHFDMAENVVKIAGVEFYSQTGFFPEMDTQFGRINSFTYEFTEQFDRIFSNPPYGGDKNNKSPEILRLESILEENDKIIKNITKELDNNKDNFNKEFKNLKLDLEKNFDSGIINKDTNHLINLDKFQNKVKDFTEDFCANIKIDYDTNKENFYKLTRILWQNIIIKNMIKKETEESYKQKVNYDTCSKFIKDYAKEITEYNDKTTRTLYIKEIDRLLQTEKETVKIDNLKKTKKKIEKELEKYKLIEKNIKFNDKESCSLILLMNLLADDGICIAVLKEGVFFDDDYSDIRLFLINNFDVTDIWSVDAKAFENTTTKTSIIKFKKTGKTKKIEFWELDVKKYGKTIFDYDINYGTDIIEYKDKIIDIDEKFICEASYKQLMEIKTTWNKNNEPKFNIPCSFNMKDYKDYKIVCPKGYEIKKLSEFLEYEKKSKRNASFATENGTYRFYTSSDKIKKCSECDFNDDKLKLIFGTGGVGSLFIDNKFSCSADNFVCTTKDKYNLLYIYDYIKTNWKIFIDRMFNGSTLGHINKDRLDNCEIPFPKNMDKLKPQLDKLYKLYQEIMNGTEQIPQSERDICELIKKATDEGKKGVDYEEYKLGDVIEIKSGKPISENNRNGTKYKYITSNGYNGFVDEYLFDGKYVIIAQDGNSIGITHLIKGKFFPSNHVWVISSNILKIEYIYIYMKYIYDYNKINTGSVLGKITKENLTKSLFKVLTENKMKKLKLQDKFDEVDKLKETLEKNKEDYQKYMKELFKDFEEKDESDNSVNSSESDNSDKSDNSDNSNSSDSEEEKPEQKPIKKNKKQTKQKSSSEDSEESDDEDDEKPKKIVKPVKPVKTIEISDEKSKPVKKVESSSSESDNSDSSTDSSSESESSTYDNKIKKKVNPVNKSK